MHRPFSERDKQRIEHFEFYWHVLAIQLHPVDVRFQLPTGYDAVISKEVAGDLSKPAQIEARSPAIGKNKAVSRARKMAQTIATRARDRSPALTACERC